MDNQIEIKSIESNPETYGDSSVLTGVSQAKLDEIGSKCRERLESLKQQRDSSKWLQDREEDFNAYHVVAPKRDLPYVGYPNLACPLTRIGIDTMHANTLFTFAGQQGKFNVLPDFLSRSHIDSAERTAKYMTYVLNYEAGLYDALDKADLDDKKYGIGYLEASYERKTAWESRTITVEEVVPKIDELTGEVTRETKKRKKQERVQKVLFDGVKVRRIHPESIYVSPFFECVKDAVDQDYLFKVTNYSFRRLEELSKEVDGIPAFFKAAQVKKLRNYCARTIESRLEANKQQYDGFMVDQMVETSPIELAEAHFRSDINDDGLSEKVTVVFETSSGIVLRATYGDCRIVALKSRPVDGRWQGESVRKIVEPLIREWEAIHNDRVAKGQWENLPFFFYRAGGRFNPQTLTLMPGRGYPIDNPQDVSFPQFSRVGQSYFNEEKLLMDLIDRVLALGDAMQGIASGDSTATETIHAQQRAGIRLSTPMNRIALALNELVGHIWELNKQCAPDVKEFKVVGMGEGSPVFDKITSSDYDAMVSFKLSMATMYDVQMLRDTALLNYRTFISNPMFMNNPAAFYVLTQQTMKAVGLDVPLPKPEQAKARSPWLEHDMIRKNLQEVEPVIGEDTEEHLLSHAAFMRSDEFKSWPEDAKQRLLMHYDKTQILKETLQASNLNQSGIYDGGNPALGAGGTPAFTANRNPTQPFNTMRVAETPKSAQQNQFNGMQGGNK